MSTAIVNIWFYGWVVNYTVFPWTAVINQKYLTAEFFDWPVRIKYSKERCNTMLWGLSLFWKQTNECGKTRGWSAHVSTPCECGQETVKWGSGVEMPVPNPANAPLRPLHTPVPPSSPPVMPGIPRTLSEKSKQPGSKKNRLWRVAAMCRLSACQAHFFEKHKRGQHGLQPKLRCNQGGFTPVRSRQWACSDNSASLHKTDYDLLLSGSSGKANASISSAG